MIATSLVDTVAKQQIASVIVGLLLDSLCFAARLPYPSRNHERVGSTVVGNMHSFKLKCRFGVVFFPPLVQYSR